MLWEAVLTWGVLVSVPAVVLTVSHLVLPFFVQSFPRIRPLVPGRERVPSVALPILAMTHSWIGWLAQSK